MGRGYGPQGGRRNPQDHQYAIGGIEGSGLQGLIGVNAVDVTRTALSVYVTALGRGAAGPLAETEKTDILNAFQRSRGFIRTELARLIQIRHIPELLFRFDTSVEYGLKMDKILSGLDIPADSPEEQEE